MKRRGRKNEKKETLKGSPMVWATWFSVLRLGTMYIDVVSWLMAVARKRVSWRNKQNEMKG